MYIDNDWYGNKSILLKYCNIKKNKKIFASIQHGYVIPDSRSPNLGRRTIENSPWLVWNENISNFCLRNKIKNVIPIGAPILYLLKNKKKIRKKKIEGTLVFPLLSHPEQKNITDYEKMYKYVKKKFEGPITFSVSFSDYKILKKNKNYKFVTFGNRGDKNYLHKLINEILLKKNIVHIYPGSGFIYSLFLKKKTYLIGDVFLKKNKKDLKQIYKNINYYKKDLKKNGFNFKKINSKNNYNVACTILGKNFIKSKLQLIKLLGLNSKIKNILALIFSKLIDIKHDFKNGYKTSDLERRGIVYKYK